jgi:hypothetical protein
VQPSIALIESLVDIAIDESSHDLVAASVELDPLAVSWIDHCMQNPATFTDRESTQFQIGKLWRSLTRSPTK